MKKITNWFVRGTVLIVLVIGSVFLKNYLGVRQNSNNLIENRKKEFKLST